MIDTKAFNNLKKVETSSWAVWNEDNDNSLDFFLSKQELFHSRVIFVGLNRSNAANDFSKAAPLSNFHAKGHTGDKRLKRFIQDANLSNLLGGFMTDISEQIETNSNEVMVEKQKAVRIFIDKIRLIDDFQTRHIICFGDKVFNTFINALRIVKSRITDNSINKVKEVKTEIGNETWHLYRVWHYSNYGTFLRKSEEELPVQLRYINDKISSKSDEQ
ncbi:MAG: hypothetical protein LC768_03380 [Acidobacteria bacterium]|nr:hypothetical protein [Acidobacteriota bacterium]MCA1637370.1 hypothetical protein [Acidobacteriota bacterium]